MPITVTRTYTLYYYHELDEEAKQNAKHWLFQYPNTAQEILELIQADAEEIGLEITGYDLHTREIWGELKMTAAESMVKAKEHYGQSTNFYTIANSALANLRLLLTQRDKLIDLQQKDQETIDRIWNVEPGQDIDSGADRYWRELELQLTERNQAIEIVEQRHNQQIEAYEKNMLDAYLGTAKQELAYRLSDDYVNDMMEANGYTFDATGKRMD